MPRPIDRLKPLLDRDRLAVIGAVAAAPGTIAELAERTGRTEQTVQHAIADLVGAGLVERTDAGFDLDEQALCSTARELAESDVPMDPVIGFGMTDAEREVLARYFEGRTLTEIPSSRAKRLIVLERLAQEFDLGKRYPESDVDTTLRTFHPDTAALRRYLIDEDLLAREHGSGGPVYWRSGGRVTPS